MEQLVKLVAEKAGISEDIAKIAVDVVLGFLKGKLPKPFADNLDGIVAGDVDPTKLMGGGGLGGILKGLLGGK
ncbi:MAG: hypothetical protein H6672_08870 [Anaerolineaceae bacterium]|nr:hypothetical protein [Anaerolineaceae bacterium]